MSLKLLPRSLASTLLGLQAACSAQPALVPECRLQNPALGELSGLATAGNGDYYWGLNDSGGQAWLFRVGPCGENLGHVEIEGALNRDWEDIAYFDDHGTPSLLIADTGDNQARRKRVRLYAVAEPEAQTRSTTIAWQQDFTYPDGPRDAESLAVDPRNGDILVLSKRENPQHLFRVPRGAGVMVAEDLGPVATIQTKLTLNWLRGMVYQLYGSLPTALDISRDGRRIAVLTLTELFVWTRQGEEDWAELMNREPHHYVVPASLEQAESMAFTAEGDTVVISSENAGAPMIRIEVSEALP